jgi:hypothetical protein
VEKLGEVLLAIGAISASALNRALMMQRSAGGRLGTILLEQGIVTEETLARALAKVTGRNFAHWDRVKNASNETIALIPARLAVRHFAVPFEVEGRVLRVAMRDPNDLAAADEIAQVVARRVEPWCISEVRLLEAIERFYGERRSARYRVLSDRLERGIRPQTPPPVPPPPPEIRGPARPPAPEPGLTPVPGLLGTSDIWKRMSTGLSDEIEIATWRPSSFVKPAPPVETEIEFSPEEAPAVSEPAERPGPAPAAAPPPPEPGPGAPPPVPPPEPKSTPAPAVGETEASAGLPEPPRPETPEEARERILSAGDREAIADAALSYIEPFFPLVALFIARKDDVIGWQVRSPTASRSGFKATRIPFRDPSIFLNVRLSGAPYQGPLPELPSHAPILEAFGRRPDHCAIFPVFLRKRIVAFLFVEHTRAALPKERVDEMKKLASAIADGLAALIVQQRGRS